MDAMTLRFRARNEKDTIRSSAGWGSNFPNFTFPFPRALPVYDAIECPGVLASIEVRFDSIGRVEDFVRRVNRM